jgi:hypothetical protein
MNRIYSICDDVNKPGNEMLKKISRSTDLPNEPREIFGKLRYSLQLTSGIPGFCSFSLHQKRLGVAS